jgi:large conductance mechanosensitive channel
MGKFLSDFKAFAMRGNVVDMAVGVIIGGAFGQIVTSLVNDVMMPVIGFVTGGIDFKNFKYILKDAVVDANNVVITPAVSIDYGVFINYVINFIIVAFCIFVAIRTINKFRKQEEAAPAAPPAPSKEEVLLTEIRDLLKQQASK